MNFMHFSQEYLFFISIDFAASGSSLGFSPWHSSSGVLSSSVFEFNLLILRKHYVKDYYAPVMIPEFVLEPVEGI